MLSFIILFFPAVITVWIYECLYQTNLKKKAWLLVYITSVLLVNLCCLVMMTTFLNASNIVLDSLLYGLSIGIAVPYLLFAFPISVLWGVIFTFVKKNLRIEVEDPTNDNN